MSKIDTYSQFFQEEVHVHYKAVLLYACTLTRDLNSAEDLTQEVMLRAWKNVVQMQTYSDVKSVLLTMTKNIHTDFCRAKKNTFITLIGDESISEVAEPSNILLHFKTESEKAELAKIIDRLSDEEKEIILQYDILGRSMIEISKDMNLKYSTAISRRKRALKKAKKVAAELNISGDTIFDDGY